ncbi:MAG: hypothetical protein FWE40_00975 [Oscillospiraceae bacterium]|nr:hypothetical protein [Oscillospiraceae bacterium]
MEHESRMFGELEVVHAIHIGDKEVLFLLDKQNTERPYIVSYNQLMFGLDYPTETVGSADYLEMMEEFLQRVQGQIDQVREDRARSCEPQEVFTQAQCLPPSKHEERFIDRVVVINAERLRPEYGNIANQVVYITGGFGAEPSSRGGKVYGHNVFSGEQVVWRREHVLGILAPAHAPDWVKPGVDAIRAQQKSKGGKEHGR